MVIKLLIILFISFIISYAFIAWFNYMLKTGMKEWARYKNDN